MYLSAVIDNVQCIYYVLVLCKIIWVSPFMRWQLHPIGVNVQPLEHYTILFTNKVMWHDITSDLVMQKVVFHDWFVGWEVLRPACSHHFCNYGWFLIIRCAMITQGKRLVPLDKYQICHPIDRCTFSTISGSDTWKYRKYFVEYIKEELCYKLVLDRYFTCYRSMIPAKSRSLHYVFLCKIISCNTLT